MKNKLFFLVTVLTASIAMARWGKVAESPYVVNLMDINNKVKTSGAYETSYHRVIEIKNEKGRNSEGLHRFTYNPEAEKLDYVKAKTINGKNEFVVTSSNIVIKPLSHNGPGFDTQNQVSIAYPNVEIGSKLELSYHLTRTKPTLPGYFSDHFQVGRHAAYENYKEVWESESPLYSEVFDPNGYLTLTQSKNKVEVTLSKPLYAEIIEEKNAIFSPESLVWVGISSINKWSDFPKQTINAYEKVINSPLPESFQKIVEEAKKVSDPSDQINAVTSRLEDTLRYLGDWRLVKGAYHPRQLSVIAKSGYGDCKDMSVSAASILNRLGFKAHAAFVNREYYNVSSPLKLPAVRFNHAIVWAEKDGKEYWIDPTNNTSSSRRIYPDIADRESVILLPEGARESKTPAGLPASNVIKIDLDINLKNDSELSGEGKIQLLGFGAESVTGDELSSSKAQIDYRLITWATNIPDLTKWKFEDYDLKSRIVKDFAVGFTFNAGWQSMTSSAGKGFLISQSGMTKVINTSLNEREASLFLSDPFEYYRNIKLSGKDFQSNKDINCDGNYKWFDFKRESLRDGSSLVLKDHYSIKMREVDIKELRTPEFRSAQQAFFNCLGDFAFIFR